VKRRGARREPAQVAVLTAIMLVALMGAVALVVMLLGGMRRKSRFRLARGMA